MRATPTTQAGSPRKAVAGLTRHFSERAPDVLFGALQGPEWRSYGPTRSYNEAMVKPFDICIRGTGIVGRTLALLLAKERFRVALTGAPLSHETGQTDVRAYALNAASKTTLESLRCWPTDDRATAVAHMQVQGGQQGTVNFDAGTLRVPALAWITDVPALEARLTDAIRYQPDIEWRAEPVAAPLTAVCEGRASQTRQELGVEFDVSPYEQTAVATRVLCSEPHQQTARQWFSADGILALLPLGGKAGREMAVVWSVSPQRAADLLELSEEDFAHQLNQASAGAFGTIELEGQRCAWPLQLALAKRWCGRFPDNQHAWVLAGDAAHTVHPLSGQGLNLGIADAAALSRALSGRAEWRRADDQRILRQYARERRSALLPMRLGTDLLAQLFAQQMPAWESLRHWGMQGFDRSGPLKRWAARQAMGASGMFTRTRAQEETAP